MIITISWMSYSKVSLNTIFENFGRGTKPLIVHIIMMIWELINFLGKLNNNHQRPILILRTRKKDDKSVQVAYDVN